VQRRQPFCKLLMMCLLNNSRFPKELQPTHTKKIN